jgi:hypothetical protein
MTQIAIGARTSPPSEMAIATGIMPNTIAAVVIMIGRKRMMPACTKASRTGLPSARSWFAKSTSRIAFFVTRPINMMMPIIEKMLSVLPVRYRPPNAPTTDKGNDSMMLNGWMKLSNCAARIM